MVDFPSYFTYYGIIFYWAYWDGTVTQTQLQGLVTTGKITQAELDWIIANPPA